MLGLSKTTHFHNKNMLFISRHGRYNPIQRSWDMYMGGGGVVKEAYVPTWECLLLPIRGQCNQKWKAVYA